MLAPPTKPIWDELYSYGTIWEKRAWVIPWSCECCKSCWLRTNEYGQPIKLGDKIKCVWDGPYKGYIEVLDP